MHCASSSSFFFYLFIPPFVSLFFFSLLLVGYALVMASTSTHEPSTSACTILTFRYLPLTRHNLRLHQIDDDKATKLNRVLAFVKCQQENILLESRLHLERQRQIDSMVLLEKPSWPFELIVSSSGTPQRESQHDDGDTDAIDEEEEAGTRSTSGGRVNGARNDYASSYRAQKWQLIQQGLTSSQSELSSLLFSSICTSSASSSSYSPLSSPSNGTSPMSATTTTTFSSILAARPHLHKESCITLDSSVQLPTISSLQVAFCDDNHSMLSPGIATRHPPHRLDPLTGPASNSSSLLLDASNHGQRRQKKDAWWRRGLALLPHRRKMQDSFLSFRYPKTVPMDALRDAAIHLLTLPTRPSSSLELER
ncbi:hypothetical protein BC940DRAFT_313532 [Gongronella butleri]|nr:hypothetical protein BC940DRAFT_313532 [Gongronella butleri]